MQGAAVAFLLLSAALEATSSGILDDTCWDVWENIKIHGHLTPVPGADLNKCKETCAKAQYCNIVAVDRGTDECFVSQLWHMPREALENGQRGRYRVYFLVSCEEYHHKYGYPTEQTQTIPDVPPSNYEDHQDHEEPQHKQDHEWKKSYYDGKDTFESDYEMLAEDLLVKRGSEDRAEGSKSDPRETNTEDVHFPKEGCESEHPGVPKDAPFGTLPFPGFTLKVEFKFGKPADKKEPLH